MKDKNKNWGGKQSSEISKRAVKFFLTVHKNMKRNSVKSILKFASL